MLFLAKSNEKFEDDSEFIELIKDIVSYGESIEKDFLSIKFTLISQWIRQIWWMIFIFRTIGNAGEHFPVNCNISSIKIIFKG